MPERSRIPRATRTDEAGSRARHLFLVVAVGCLVFLVYGSLLPFEFQGFDLSQSWRQFVRSIDHPPSLRGGGRVDFYTNLIVLMPFGFGMMGWRQAGLSRKWSTIATAAGIVLTGACISVGVELLQSALPRRVPSAFDVIAQIIGVVVGIVAWLIAGRPLVDWYRRLQSTRRNPARLESILKAYTLVLMIVSLLPFDLTIHPGDLWDKYQLGRIKLVPFDGFEFNGFAVLELMLDGLLFIPVGMLMVTLWTTERRPVRSVFGATLAGIVVVAALELMQLFVFSRFTHATDVVVGACGILAGAWIGHRVAPGFRQAEASRPAAYSWWSLAALSLAIPCCCLWWPFDFTGDSRVIREGVTRISLWPFETLIVGSSPLRAVSHIAERTVLYVPFGLFLGNGLRGSAGIRSGRFPTVFCVLAAGGAATVFEIGQVFLPSRVPDVTDPLLAALGAGVGVFVSRQIANPRNLPEDRSLPRSTQPTCR